MNKYLFAAVCTILALSVSVLISANSKTKNHTRVISSFEPQIKPKTADEEPLKEGEVKFPHVKAFEKEMKQIADQAVNSCVRIITIKQPKDDKTSEYNIVNFSGIIVKSDGYILTLAQPLKDVDEIHVNIGLKSYIATRWDKDNSSQLAIIKINAKDLPEAKFSNVSDVQAGSIVVLSGNPYNLNGSVKFTTVSGVDRIMYINGVPNFGVFQIDTSTNPGEPGGPCLNSDGEIMGILWSSYVGKNEVEESDTVEKIMDIVDRIVKPEMKIIARQVIVELLKELTAKYGSSSLYENEGISFVLPADQLKKISDNLIKYKEVKNPYVGIKIDGFSDFEKNTQTFKIKEVSPDSPAEKSELKVGDELIAIDGKPILSLLTVYKRLSVKNPGDEIELTIKRDGTEQKIKLVLGEYPK